MATPAGPIPGATPAAPAAAPAAGDSYAIYIFGTIILVIAATLATIAIFNKEYLDLTSGQIIGIAVGFVIVTGLLINYASRIYTFATKTPAEAAKYFEERSANKEWALKAITAPFTIIIYFLPYFVAFYAIFNDIVTSTFSLSLGVVVGVILNVINWGIAKGIKSVAVISDLCGIPGLSGMNSTIIPQAPLFVSTVTAYIATFTTLLHGAQSTPTYTAWGLFTSFALAQYYTLAKNRTTCLDPMQGIYGFGGGVFSPLISIAIGLGVGGLTGLYGTKFITTATGTPSGRVSSAGGPLGSSTTPPDSGVGTCSPPNDQDQFVCETYKDGKLVTSTIASS